MAKATMRYKGWKIVETLVKIGDQLDRTYRLTRTGIFFTCVGKDLDDVFCFIDAVEKAGA